MMFLDRRNRKAEAVMKSIFLINIYSLFVHLQLFLNE